MLLYIAEDGELSVTNKAPTQEDLTAVYENYLQIIRFQGAFEIAEVDCEEIPDDEDDPDGDSHTEYSIVRWAKI